MSIDEMTRKYVDPDLGLFAFLGGAERDAMVLDHDREIRRLTVQRAAMIQIVATSGSFTDDAHHTPRAWIQAVLNVSTTTANELVRTVTLLHHIPDLAAATASGRIGPDQLREIARLVVRPVLREQLAEHGTALIEPAARLEYDQFTIVLNRWKAHADPDGTHHDHHASRERRHVRTGVTGHTGIIHAEGDAASTDEMTDILRAHTESEFLKDCHERRTRFGDDADQHPLRRTHGQRCFDALQEIFRKAAHTPLPGISEPTVNIFTTETDFAEAARHYFAQQTPGTSAPTSTPAPSGPPGWTPPPTGRICENEHGSPVDPADMIVSALLGRVRSVIVTDDGRYLHATSRKRLFTGKLRDMILLLGRHQCSRHGCQRDGPSIQIDHLDSYHCGGCTTALNGGPLCPLHNRNKHDLALTITHDQHGWHHHRPDGTEIAPRGTEVRRRECRSR
ncbi:MAG: DUF222 domain-containing protein [Ilumatobacteraceae bacterium]